MWSRVWPDFKCTVIGIFSEFVVEVLISNSATSPTRVALLGRAVSGISKAPFLVLWNILFATGLISRAMSADDTPPPMRSTFFHLRFELVNSSQIESIAVTHLALKATWIPEWFGVDDSRRPTILGFGQPIDVWNQGRVVMTGSNDDSIKNLHNSLAGLFLDLSCSSYWPQHVHVQPRSLTQNLHAMSSNLHATVSFPYKSWWLEHRRLSHHERQLS